METPPLVKRELTLEQRVERLEEMLKTIAREPGNPHLVAEQINWLFDLDRG